MGHLDYREKCGYRMQLVAVQGPAFAAPVRAIVYTGTPESEEWLGDGPLDQLAAQIATSHGPSGRNCDYLFHLADAMRHIAPHHTDSHLLELEARVRTLLQA